MKTRNGRKGFTLVELLVVISIIGMLMALLLPAVQSAREAGRANTCRNNMRNVGLAMIQFETQKSRYPGYVESIGVGNNAARSWTYAILPYNDRRAVYELYKDFAVDPATGAQIADVNGTPNANLAVSLEVMTCPSNPPESLGVGSTNFALNSGQVDGVETTTRPADFAGNGVFHRRVALVSGAPVVTQTASYIAGSDGLQVTIMLAENADLNRWTDIAERWAGITYHTDDGLPSASVTGGPLGINAQFGKSKISPTPADIGWMRPSSFHPGGVNMMFCDGHVRFISETMDYGVFQALMSSRGTAALNALNGNALADGGDPDNVHAAMKVVDESGIQ